MKLVVTGGAGFIGSNFIRHVLESDPETRVVNLDRLSYAGNLESLKGLESDPRYRFFRGDIAEPAHVEEVVTAGVDAVVNFAAESHVDRSILDPSGFVRTNVTGTQILLEACRRARTVRFLQISTDEVYGSLEDTGRFTEETPLAPNSPYSASKAAADLLARSYHGTYGLDIVITRCSNNYGPFQFPEKLIPLMILNALEDRPLPLYGDGLNVRDWIHVSDHCRAIERILQKGSAGATYNVGSGQEQQNLQVVRRILEILGKGEDLIQFVEDRPGHDRRYAIDSSRLQKELGWGPQIGFTEGLAETVAWYQQNSEWVAHVRSGEYTNYYRQMYTERSETLNNL